MNIFDARKVLFWAGLVALALPSLASGADAKPDPIKLEPSHCAMASMFRSAVCMRATVPENYALPAGRQIGLDIAIVKASAASASSASGRALFILQGGPGQRTTSTVWGVVDEWQSVRETEDLVFVDQRGTGSTPDLRCETSHDESVLLRDLWPAADFARCAEQLSSTADLTRYTTTDAARDIDNVRAALSLRQIDIVAYSYGTRLAQEYLRHYDQTVHAALLIGPEAPDAPVPAGMARQADLSLGLVLQRCKLDAACAAAFPDVDGDLARLKAILNDGGLVLQEATKNRQEIRMSAGVVASYLRTRLYEAQSAVTLPRLIHALATGGPGDAQRKAIASWRSEFSDAAPWGLYMAVTCTEDVPFVDVDKERRLAAGTLLGSYRIDQQVAACEKWPHRPVAPEFMTPVATSAPVLVLVGELDPATPASHGASVVARMTDSRLIVVRNRAHDVSEDWDRCLRKVTATFLETANPKALDASCVDTLTLPKFDVSMSSKP